MNNEPFKQFFGGPIKSVLGFPGGASGKEPACQCRLDEREVGLMPGSGRSPGEGNGKRSSILAWEIPWTEEPGGLQSIGSQRVGHDLATKQQQWYE